MPKVLRYLYVALGLCAGLCMSTDAFAWNPLVVSGRCQQTGNRCSGTIGNAGQGSGACCDPAQGTSATLQCEKSNTCTGGNPYKWADNQLPLKWWFNPNGMPGQSGYQGMSEAQIEGWLKQAFDGWTKPACTSFRHNYRGKSQGFLSTSDGQTTMFLASQQDWARYGAGSSTLAFTRPIPNNRGELQDADIAFNPVPGGRRWSQGLFLATAAHEMGHAIGFAHTGDPKALMYFAASGQTSTLTKDETDAVCFTYKKKGPCSTDADCGGCLRCSGGTCVDKSLTQGPKQCHPCNSTNDCGGGGSICIRLEEGQRCVQPCDSAGCCPNGLRCADIGSGQTMCIPDTGKCADFKCTSDTNCGPGEQCTGGVCKPKPVPLGPKTCKVCASATDCGNGSQCLRFDGQNRCLQNCVADNFCPNGYKCTSTGVGRVCLPEGTFCPCSGNSDCLQNEACRGGVCRPFDCKFGCACTEDSQCSPGHQCLPTQDGSGICAQLCGASAGFPKGVPGSACNNGQCSGGANCYDIGGGNNICMKPCSSPNDCAATGGQCFRLGGSAFCLCQNDGQCKSGQACNQSVLGQFGGGACATKGTAGGCETDYECKDASGSGQLFVCQPKAGNKGAGAKCFAPNDCGDGLQCLQIDPNAQNGVCFEECTGTNQCKFGGSCILGSQGSNRRFCGCAAQAPCSSGTCETVANGVGVCKGGGTTTKCGDGTCNGTENCGTCAQDCKCATGESCQNNACVKDTKPATCGDGRCAGTETCGNCPDDCGCATGQECINNTCQTKPADNCGDGKCDSRENCDTCAKDCACKAGETCQAGLCKTNGSGTDGGTNPDTGTTTDKDSNTLPCSESEQFIGEDGKPQCPTPKTGCGCSSDGKPNATSLFFLLMMSMLVLFAATRRRLG